MARSSFGPNRAATWKVSQRPRPLPRIVRVGRPANDNRRRHRVQRTILLLGLAGALFALVVMGARLI